MGSFFLDLLSFDHETAVYDKDPKCDVYSVDGRVIARGAEGVGALNLDPGIYIVKEGGKARKIRVD